jgi:single-strand DNA-binding protein
MNQVILIGRLGADPELRQGANDTQICKFRLATDNFQTKTADWHQVVCFGKTAQNCAKYLTKGKQVALIGRITYRKWDKDDGTTQWFTEIIANSVKFLEASSQAADGQPEPDSSSGNVPF